MAVLTMTLGGITFNGAADGNGVLYRVSRFEGWDGPDVRISTFARVGAEGEILTESAYASRPIILRGHIIAPSYTALWAGWNALQAATDCVSTDGTLVVNEPTPKQVTVRRSGRLSIDWISATAAEWQCPFIAVDPRKYAVSQSSVALL